MFAAALVESLEDRRLMAFGLTTANNNYTVDTGSGLVFSVLYGGTVTSTLHLGDLTSATYNGTQVLAAYSVSGRYSHYEEGLSSGTTFTTTVDPNNKWILIACNDTGTGGTGVIQYYLARNGYNNIYMASYSAGPSSPSPGEMRFITYTNPSVFTNIPTASNNSGGTAIESSDVFGHPDGTTSSKYYGEYRAIDTQTYGDTGTGIGVFMNIGNRETSSGGPFFKDIDFQNNELYTYVFSGHSQTENFRPGLKGFYALEFTNGTTPAAPDYSFIDTLDAGSYISGYTGSSGRGTLTGTANGVPSTLQETIGLSNAADEYWTLPDATAGSYTISGVLPGTYTETIYQGELAAGTQTVTITAGQTTAFNITDTFYTPSAANTVFRIGTWDGTPLGFLNSNLITYMHPTDVRMSPWAADSTGLTNFIVGTDADSSFPMAEWHAQNSAAPYVDTDNRITFTLTATQAATLYTFRIGLTRLDSARPNITVNGTYTTAVQGIATEPDSRGLTTGNWRGNNTTYSFNIPSGKLTAGTNTIDIYSVSGSTGTLYSGYHIYDALDLVATSSINAPAVATLSISPANKTVPVSSQQTFIATAYDSSGNVIPANVTWSTTLGSIDNSGAFIAPSTAGSGTVTATAGTVTGTTNITAVVGTPPTVATAASASPSPVAGTTTTVSVLGADDGGESNLTYTWSATGPGTVSYSANASNTAKTSVVTFTSAGSYTFTVTIKDATNLTATSSVSVVVNQTLTGVVPTATTMAAGTFQQITAADQFGLPMTGVTLTWSASAGTITSSGEYIAPASGSSSATITGMIGTFSKAATISIISPLAWYQADQTAGPSLTDSSGNNKTGTLTGAYNFSTGVIGNAAHFTGGYATLPTGIVSTVSDFTIAAWINVTTLTNWERIFDFGTGTTNYMFLTPDAGTTNALRFAINTGSGEQQLNGGAIPAGTWTQVAVTLTGSTATLYVNGAYNTTNTAMTLHPSSLGVTNLNYLGKSQFSTDPALQGSIDDLRIYNTGLSAAGIASLYQTTIHTPTVATISATPTPVTGQTTTLASLGSEQAGESNLTYTWSSTGPAGVTFSANASNAAKNAMATFTKAGAYTLIVTANDALGYSATDSAAVTVSQTATSLTISPTPVILGSGATQQFAVAVVDQFGNAISSPAVTWTATNGTINSSAGLFTAGQTAGTYTVTATSGSASATVSSGVVPTNYPASAGDGFYVELAADHVTEQIWTGTPGSVGPSFGTATYSVLLTNLPSLTFGPGSSASGGLTINASNGSPIPAGGITYDGGAGGDTLNLLGSSGNDAVSVNSTTVSLGSGTITYANLESIAVTLGAGTNSLTQSAQPGNSAMLSLTDPTATDSLTINGGAFTLPAPPANSGIVQFPLASLTVGSSAKWVVSNATSHADRYLLILGSLSITGTIDLGDNDLDLQNATPLIFATVGSLLTQGYSQGSWTGTGITSSSAATDTSHLKVLGIIQNNQSGSALFTAGNKFDGTTPGVSDILIKYTYYGDANLDGKVDGSDYSLIDSAFLSHATGWFNGDFNYDNVINGSDYTLIDNAFNAQSTRLSAEIAAQPDITANKTATASIDLVTLPTANKFSLGLPTKSAAIDFTPAAHFSSTRIALSPQTDLVFSRERYFAVKHIHAGKTRGIDDSFSSL